MNYHAWARKHLTQGNEPLVESLSNKGCDGALKKLRKAQELNLKYIKKKHLTKEPV